MRIKRGSLWVTKSGRKMMVINIAKHADDCTVKFVYYTNVDNGFDCPQGEKWILEKETFKQRYKPLPEGD